MTPEQSARQVLLDKRRSLLIRYRDELESAGALHDVREADWEDLAGDQREAAIFERLSDADARELRAIVEALRRIEAGTFGRCEHCGEPIAVDRLAALPETVLCVECATEAEAPPPEPPEETERPPAEIRTVRARVVRPMPGLRFHLESDTGYHVTAALPHGLRFRRLRLSPGDTVVVEVSEQDPHHARLVPGGSST